MENEVYAFALQETLTEIQDVCPDINNAFIFRENGEIVAGDKKTTEKTMRHIIDSFGDIFKKKDAIGNIESITLECSKGRVNVSSLNEDYYILTVTSRKADMKYLNTITSTVIPTVLKLLKKIHPAPFKNKTASPEMKHEISMIEEPVTEEIGEVPEETGEKEVKPENLLPEPPIQQLIVESLSGFFVSSDTVRIDKEILSQWKEMCEDKKINMVEIETFNGKTANCKVKPIKDSRYERKGMIQIPEKVQGTLDIREGELVRVKPIINEEVTHDA